MRKKIVEFCVPKHAITTAVSSSEKKNVFDTFFACTKTSMILCLIFLLQSSYPLCEKCSLSIFGS